MEKEYGPTWKWIAVVVIGILITIVSWTINDLYGRDRDNKLAIQDTRNLIVQAQKEVMQEISQLKNCIIGKDRYQADMQDVRDDLKTLLRLNLKKDRKE